MLKIFAILLAVLVLLPTVLWGFPGAWALTAIIPAFILAATFAHLRQEPDPEDGKRRIRPSVMSMGVLFGVITSGAAVLLMWAAGSSPLIVITVDRHIDMARNVVWTTLNDEHQQWREQTWLSAVEGYGKGGTPGEGSVFRSMIQLEGHQVKGDHTVDVFVPGSTFGWTIAPAGGSRLEGMHETIALTDAEDGGTVAHYELRYAVNSVIGRTIERLTLRRSLEKVAEHTMGELDHHVMQ